MVNNKLPKRFKLGVHTVPTHLSLWQNHLHIDSLKEWCGSYDVPWKKRIRKHIQDARVYLLGEDEESCVVESFTT